MNSAVSSPRIAGPTGRCPLPIPFGISAVQESQVQPRIDRSKASRMKRNRQEQRPGGGAGRTRR